MYRAMFRRRRKSKTDYRQRLTLLKSNKPRFVVRKALNNIHIQIVTYSPEGDQTILEEISKNLKKHGWKGHCGSTPAAYLCGLQIGVNAVKKGINESILDLGLQKPSSVLFSAAQGARDAGLMVAGQEVPIERLRGEHIANYASRIDKQKYKNQFSALMKSGLEIEKLPEHFDEIKEKITVGK